MFKKIKQSFTYYINTYIYYKDALIGHFDSSHMKDNLCRLKASFRLGKSRNSTILVCQSMERLIVISFFKASLK